MEYEGGTYLVTVTVTKELRVPYSDVLPEEDLIQETLLHGMVIDHEIIKQ